MRDRNDANRRQQESLRRRYRPARLRLLFVGESPPASGRFFYQGDSGLYRAIRDAFRTVDASITDESFLARFQASGCYLIDLCAEPVDHLDPQTRRAACRESQATLSQTIARLHPLMIATVVRSIEGIVTLAASGAGWHGPFIHLPYPGRWSRHRDVFVDTLAEQLPALLSSSGKARGLNATPDSAVAAAKHRWPKGHCPA